MSPVYGWSYWCLEILVICPRCHLKPRLSCFKHCTTDSPKLPWQDKRLDRVLPKRVAPSMPKTQGACGEAARGEATEISMGKVGNNIFLGNRKISRILVRESGDKGREALNSDPSEIQWHFLSLCSKETLKAHIPQFTTCLRSCWLFSEQEHYSNIYFQRKIILHEQDLHWPP